MHRLFELIASKRLEGHLQQGYMIYDFQGSLDTLQTYLDLDAHIMLTARHCDAGDSAALARQICARVPSERLLLATNAP